MKSTTFRYKTHDLKTLSRKRQIIGIHSPIAALIHSSVQDRQDMFTRANHEDIARDALNYTGEIRKLTKARMEQHVKAGGFFQHWRMTEYALSFVQCEPYRRQYLTDRRHLIRGLAVRYMPTTDLMTLISDRSVVVRREVFRWGDQSVQDAMIADLMADDSQPTYRWIVKYAHSVQHRANAKLLVN